MSKEKSKFCTNCGERLEEGLKFCTSCGDVLEVDDIKENVSEKEVEATPVDVEVTEATADEENASSIDMVEDVSEKQVDGKEKTSPAKILMAVLVGVLAALLVAVGLGFAMPDSPLGQTVTSIFFSEDISETVMYEPIEEETIEEVIEEELELPVLYEPIEELEELEEENALDAEFCFRETLAEIRALGDTGNAGAIGRFAADFNANDGRGSPELRAEGERLQEEISRIVGHIVENAPHGAARDGQLELLSLCMTRVQAIMSAMDVSANSATWRQHLDSGREAREWYERIIEAGGLY